MIYVNRSINLKKIKAIGLDMDYTIVRYNSEAFESFTFYQVVKKLIELKGYPKELKDLQFDYDLVIQGLVIDKHRGNLLKLSCFGKVKQAYHGLSPLTFKDQQHIYKNIVDLSDAHIQSLDTSFSVSNGVLYSLLVDKKEKGLALPDFYQLAIDIKEMLDLSHADGTLKNEVKANIKKYIIQDPQIPEALERLKKYGKKILIITNSDYNYTKLLMDYTFNPFLKEHKTWSELFHLVVTVSQKPRFFTERSHFFEVDSETALMKNYHGALVPGIYQGGNAHKLQKDLGLEGDEILYLGDHIYGDVVSLKKNFNWRTGLVLEPLIGELEGIQKTLELQKEIDHLMDKKQQKEQELNTLFEDEFERQQITDKKIIEKLYSETEEINKKIAQHLKDFKSYFNPHWGELMRAGQEESRFAGQVEKYSCIYMAKVSDLLHYSPRNYFRPQKRILPHEID